VEDTTQDPLVAAARQRVDSVFAMRMPELETELNRTEDEAERELISTALVTKASKLIDEASALPGSEEMLAFTAKLQNAGEVSDDYVNEALVPLIREKARAASRTPLEVGKIAEATVEAVPAVAKDLVLSLKGMAQYAPQALVGAVGGVMEDIGIGATTPEQKQAAELFGAAAEQGTRETARLLQRGARKIGALTGGPGAGQAGRLVGNVEVMEDAELDRRIQSDLAYWRRQNLVESGQRDVGAIEALLFDAKSWNRRRDDILEANADLAKQGKPLLLVPPTWEEYSVARRAARPELSKEQVEMISPLGEVFDLTNYIGVGAGAKAAKVGGRVVAEKAIRTAAEEAAAQAAKQAAEVGTVRTLAGSAVESVGKGAGRLAEKPVLRGLASAAVATAAGADPVSATLAAILGTSRMTRALAKGGPEAIESVGKAIRAPLPAPISNFVQIAKDTGAGAAYGSAGMVPFALAADSPEERGALLAGGIIYGGAGGAGAGTVRSIGDFGKSYWSPTKDDPNAPRTKGTAYGTQYDAQHSKVAATLDNPTYNRVEGLRALIRPFSDLYVLNEQDYAALPVPGIDLSQGVNSIVLPNGRKAVFVKLGGSALSHEVGEVVMEALPDNIRERVIKAYKTAYPEDVQEMMKRGYEEKVGFRLSPERAVREGIAENFHAALNGLPIANLGAKPGFAKSIYSAIGSFAEQLGLRDMTPGQGIVTSEALEYTPSFLVRRALENALESMQITAEAPVPQAPAAGPTPAAPAPAPTPTAPVAPATTDVGALVPVPTDLTKPSTELTPGAISGVTGGAPAPARTPAQAPQPAAPAPQPPRPAVAGVTEQQRTTVAGTATPELQAQNEKVLAENLNRPVEVEYLSALASDQSGKASVRLRERQLADRAEQEGVPNPFRAIFGKVVIPTSIFTVPSTGKRNIFGFSPDKLIRNIDQLRGWYLERGDKAAADHLYSPEFQQQVRNYLENQSNGYRGDGQRIARPADTDPKLYPAENPDYTPVAVGEAVRNLINFLMGLDAVSPTSLSGRWVMKLAELNGFKPASYVSGAAGKQKPVYNPLPQQLRDAGFDGSLNSAIEQLRVERMTSPAVPRPDLASIKPAVQGSVQAGFMPEAAKPEGRREIVNVGLKIGERVALTKEDVVKAFADEGIKLENVEVRGSATEPTVIASVTNADRAAIDRASNTLKQDAIAVYNPADDSGYLAGPRPENFGGKFLKEYFLMPEQAQGAFMPAPPVESEAFKKWFGKSKVVDADGKPLVVYHGTVSDFTKFDRQKANPESDFGAGFYFTNTPGDVAENYAGEGPDLQSKIERRAEEIAQEVDDKYGDSMEEHRAQAAREFKQNGGVTMAAFLRMENPFVLGTDGNLRETYLEGRRLTNFVERLVKSVDERDAGKVREEIYTEIDPDGASAKDLIEAAKKSETLSYTEDEQGRLISSELIRRAIEGAGFDGVIDFTVDEKFGSQKRLGKPMAGMTPDTAHYIAFRPTQIKSATGNIGAFSRRNTDIRYMPKGQKPLKGSLGKGKMKFFHYSDTPNKGIIDPKHFGKSGVTGGREQAGLPRAYAYAEGSLLGQDAGLIDARKHYYEGTVPKGQIYDGVEDSLGYGDMANRAKADQMLIDKGFVGIYREGLNGVKQLEFFQPMEVTEAEKPESTGPLAEEAMPILPPLALEEIDYAAQDREFARKKAAGEPLYMPKARGITSQLEATLQAIPEKASRQQIEAALRDGVKQKGQLVERPVKAEEMRDIVDQTGRSFEDFLKENPQATRQEMLDFVRQNQIQVSETRLGDPAGKFTVVERDGKYDVLRPDGTVWGEGLSSLEDARRAAARAEKLPVAGMQVRFARYQEPGGENYREVLYTLPDNPDAKRAAQERYNALVADGYPLAEALRMAEQMTPSFRSTHFADVRNYLAHARVNERVVPFSPERINAIGQKLATGMKAKSVNSLGNGAPGVGVARGYITEQEAVAFSRAKGFRNEYHDSIQPAGESMLFAEEIQSDLHQKARTEGYREPLTPDEEGALLEQQMALNREYAAAVKSDNVSEMERLEAEKQALRNRFKRAKSGIPDAPFKKSWHEFVFKNLLRDAVEQGKDWLGWTTGEQQAARYDLSKQIAKVQVMPSRQAGRERLWAYDHAGKMVLNQQIDAGTADQYVGKEVAKKLYEAPELTFRDAVMDEDKTYREVSGIDLKVGGEGMKGFYDDILPRFVDKYLKRYGIKTETISVPEAGDVHAIRITPDLRKDVLGKGQPAYMPTAVKPFTPDAAAAFMPVPRVDLEDYIGRDVVTLTTDRLDIGTKDVGPVGARKPLAKEAQGGRGFPHLYTGLGWAFSDPASASRFLTRLKATAEGDTALVATSVLAEPNVLNSPFGQHAVAAAFRHAVEAGALKEKDVDKSIKLIFSRAAKSAGGDKAFARIKSLADYEREAADWPFSFGATREAVQRLDAAELKIPAEVRQELGLDLLTLARSISDPELAGLPTFSLVSLMEIPVDQKPVKDDIHHSYPYTVKGRLLGFMKSPYRAEPLISTSRVRNRQGALTAQPMMTVMPSLDILKPSEINPDPAARLAEARLEYGPLNDVDIERSTGEAAFMPDHPDYSDEKIINMARDHAAYLFASAPEAGEYGIWSPRQKKLYFDTYRPAVVEERRSRGYAPNTAPPVDWYRDM